ncbi:MAG TPA: pyroglutamyl-peptidase I [Pirellulaceae bacterium]|nr:pyroglutamyl-peptidase I [Pirellulaceae bacterium]
MIRVLITAFEPYDRWQANSSWLTVIELTKELPTQPAIVTRRYPVDFRAAKTKLSEDLAGNYDYALHLGQAPGSSSIRLEALGLNIGGSSRQLPEEFHPLAADGPVAYQSSLPLAHWATLIRQAGIPAQVSYHAGTYLCNATLYLSHYFAEHMQLKTRSCFVHLPLSTAQAISERQDIAALPSNLAARAVRLILEDLAQTHPNL